MDSQAARRGRNPRQRVAELIGLLVKAQGSQTRLVKALVAADPTLNGLTREAVSAWVNARSLPREDAARSIATLLGQDAEEFWDAWRLGKTERSHDSEESAGNRTVRSISVLGLVWLGSRTSDLDAMCMFYENVLRLHLVHRCELDHAIYRTDNGDYVALFGPKTSRYELFTTGPVVGFRVANIAAARAEMEERGVTFIGPIFSKDNGRWKYTHYLAPDGHVYEIVEEAPWPEFQG